MPTPPGSTFFDLNAAPLSVQSVTLTVRDLDKMAKFYCEYLGLEVHDRGSRAITLGAEFGFLMLVADPMAARADPHAPGLFHVAYSLPNRADLADWLGHIAQTDLRLWGMSDHNVSEAIYFEDPEGNGIEVYADRPVDVWNDFRGDLHMPSDPLNLAALPEPRRWQGVPAQTRIGHVHFKTTDIASSEAFWTGLGLQVTARYPGGSFFGAGGYHHQIAANVWNSRGRPVQEGPKTGLSDVTLAVDPTLARESKSHMAPSGVAIHLQPKRT